MKNIKTIKTDKITWIDIKKPANEDLKWLKDNFDLHPLILKEILPPLDYPKIDKFDDYLYIVLFYPFFSRETFQTIPFELDIIVSKKYIITIHYKDIVPLKAIFDKCNLYPEIKKEYLDEGTGEATYRIIREILLACFPKLGHIKQNIDEVEKLIYSQEYKKAIKIISLVKRDIIGFQEIMKPQKLVLENLTEESQPIFGKKFVPYFNSLLNLYQQIDILLETNSKTLSTLDATNESLLSNKTNEIVKLLTIFSVIVFPLTLLAGLFGMNTSYLPIVGNPYDFWIICAIMGVGVIVMLIFFKMKKWL